MFAPTAVAAAILAASITAAPHAGIRHNPLPTDRHAPIRHSRLYVCAPDVGFLHADYCLPRRPIRHNR